MEDGRVAKRIWIWNAGGTIPGARPWERWKVGVEGRVSRSFRACKIWLVWLLINCSGGGWPRWQTEGLLGSCSKKIIECIFLYIYIAVFMYCFFFFFMTWHLFFICLEDDGKDHVWCAIIFESLNPFSTKTYKKWSIYFRHIYMFMCKFFYYFWFMPFLQTSCLLMNCD